MTRPGQLNNNNHPDDLLLPYVEGLLTPTEKHMVENHLGACVECSSEVSRLRETIALLAVHRDAFCPDEWNCMSMSIMEPIRMA